MCIMFYFEGKCDEHESYNKKNNCHRHVMHLSAIYQAPYNAVDFLWSCEGVYHKQEVCFPLSFVVSRSDCHLII